MARVEASGRSNDALIDWIFEAFPKASGRVPPFSLRGMDLNSPPTDSDLMARVVTGDRLAFKEIYCRHGPRVHAYLSRILKDRDLAADLRQEAFVRLWQARHKWRSGGSVAGYLIQAARTLSIDLHRRQKVRKRWREEARAEPQKNAPSPDMVLAQGELAARLHAAIEALPERPREVFSLKRDAGLTYREIGTVLGISPKTVEVHMSRALKLLRASLSDLRDESA